MRHLLLSLLLFVPGVAAQPALRLTLPLGGERPRLGAREAAELGAVLLTGVAHLAASEADASGVFIPAAMAGWGGYVGLRAATEPGFLRELGLTGDNLGAATLHTALVTGATVAGMAAVGAAQGSLSLEPGLVPLLALYPAWGLVQQTLVQGFVTRHLDAAGLPAVAVVPLAAGSFGLVHVPNWELTAIATGVGGAFSGLYLHDRHLVPLGVAHGVIGALFYVWVLDRDPLSSIY